MTEDNINYQFKNIKEELIAENPNLSNEDLSLFENIYNVSSLFSYPNSDVERNWESLKSKFEQQKTPIIPIQQAPKQYFMFKWLSAAVVLLILTFGLLQYINQNQDFKGTFTTLNKPSDFLLPDGSVLKLNKNTKVEVIKMNSEERLLKIVNGEALFEVKNNKTPFVVSTSCGDVKVLGTVFNIKDIKNQNTSIALIKGKIEFETEEEIIAMNPGESLLYLRDINKFIKQNNTNSIGWVNNKLEFKEQKLSNIIEELNKFYEIEFIYNKELSNEVLTITFDNLDATKAAELLTKTINSPITIK